MPMPEKKQKKLFFSEEDAAALTDRYDATTVLTLLQEVAHYPHPKIDWKELVKKTATGISNAREYQMLWRHLAYRDALPENLEQGAEPLDDDSDLECEVEALPPVSAESAAEAAACVKVMIASCTLSESTPSSSTIEAPLTISVPVSHSSRSPRESSQPSNLMQGTSIIFPVTVHRQTLPTVSSTEGIESKGVAGGNLASKRKRKAWSEEEDMQLRAAVQRWGEGNWATMAKGDNFPIKRSPTQLAQRWSILRKKDGSTNSGTILTSTQYTTAEQLATRHSLSLALDMPFKKLTTPGTTDTARTSFNSSVKSPVQPGNTTEASTVRSSFAPPQVPSQQALLGSSGSLVKSKLIPEKPAPKCNQPPDPAIKAIAVASGARIVSPSDTVSQLKVAQGRNAVDAVPTGGSLTKSTIPVSLHSNPKVHPNVPNVLTGSSAAPFPSHSAVAITAPASCTSTVKAASSTVKNSPTALPVLSEQNKHFTSRVSEVPQKQEVNPTEELRVSDQSFTPQESVQEDETPTITTENNNMEVDSNLDKGRQDLDQDKTTNLPLNKGGDTPVLKNTSEKISEDKVVSQNSEECKDQGIVKNSKATFNVETTENHQIATDSNVDKGSQDLDQGKSTNLPVEDGGECQSAINGSSDIQNMNENQEDLPSGVQDQCSKGRELQS